MPKDTFLTIKGKSAFEYKEKGSRFITLALRLNDESEIDALLSEIKEEYSKASHYCYAWRIGLGNDRYRIHDDGEPSGTAGRPIFNQILSHGLTNIMVVVVRYFGGTKLGASGLIKAYKEATATALKTAEKIEEFITETVRCEFNFEEMGHVMDVIKSSGVQILSMSFDTKPEVYFSVRITESDNTILALKAAILKKSKDEAAFMDFPQGCSIHKVL